MQKKATPIREAVVVVKENTTMNELKRLAEEFRKRWGIDTFQIHLHKDEGHWRNGEWKGNYHAHLVTDFIDHSTGKSIKLNRQDMSEMQTMAAVILNMERGTSSEKKHLSAIQFKIKAEQERLKSLENEIKEARELISSDFKPKKNILGVYKQKEVEKLLKTLKMAQIEINQAQSKLNKLQNDSAKQFKAMNEEITRLQSEVKSLKADNREMIKDENYYQAIRQEYLKRQQEKALKRGSKRRGGGLGM